MDDHARIGFTATHADERKPSAIAFLKLTDFRGAPMLSKVRSKQSKAAVRLLFGSRRRAD